MNLLDLALLVFAYAYLGVGPDWRELLLRAELACWRWGERLAVFLHSTRRIVRVAL